VTAAEAVEPNQRRAALQDPPVMGQRHLVSIDSGAEHVRLMAAHALIRFA
jgi:hypothetical protein